VGRVGEDVPVTPGVHAGGDIPNVHAGGDLPGAQVGDHLPGAHAGGDLPGGGASHTPGGSADHLPGGSAHEHGAGPSASHEPPSTHTNDHAGGSDATSHASGSHDGSVGGGSHDGSVGGHGEHPSTSGAEADAQVGDHGGNGPDGDGGLAAHGGDTSDGWEKPADESGPMQRGGNTEQQIRDQLRKSQVKPGDLERVLENLAEHPAGKEIADTLASGKFNGLVGYDQVVSSLSHADKMSGGIEQLRLGNRLYESGIHDISFELKGGVEIKPGVTTADGTDLDVMAREADGTTHGYQFKEVQNPKKLVKKIFDNMKQMEGSGADLNTFVVDTKGTLADHVALRTEQRLMDVYGKTDIQFVIRLEDGVLTIPPGGRFMPEGSL
jgi:hypothetical protein